MGSVAIAAFGLWTFVLSHLVPVLGLVAGLLVVFVFGPVATLSFLRTRVGNILVALMLAAVGGWEARALLDQSIRLRDTLVAERAASGAALVAAKAETRAALATAAEARRQALDARAVAEAAAARETAAATDAQTLQEQVDDYADQIEAARKHGGAARCALSDADARRLRSLGAAGARPR